MEKQENQSDEYIQPKAISRKRGRSPKENTPLYTVSDSFYKLCEVQERALLLEPKPDFTAVLKSEELKGKLFGLYTEHKEKEQESALPRILVDFISTNADGWAVQTDKERRTDETDEADEAGNGQDTGNF